MILYRARQNRPAADDESHSEEEVNLMTDQQKEEEAMFKQTFNFFVQGKNGAPLERYELPMILDGKSSQNQRI